MRLHVRHKTDYTYEPAAVRVSLRLKLFPSIFDGQAVENWSVKVNSEPVLPIYTTGFGDEVALWHSKEKTEAVEILAEGVISTKDKSGLVRDLSSKPPSSIFMRSTQLTRADENIRKLARDERKADALQTVHALAIAVSKAVDYRSDSTSAQTTASEAMALGAGVCQDHAHILIAACRSLDIPARYVTGYLKAAEDADELLETHAWAEAHIEDFGWVGLDPSNGISPTDHYIRIACGLDAADATPIKGHVVGGSHITLSADVAVSDSQQQ